jgi:hypothetical protein
MQSDTTMARTTISIEQRPSLIHNTRNVSQPNVAQLKLKTGSSPLANHLAHSRYILGEPGDTMDHPNLSSYQQRIPTENESYQFNDSHNFNSWLPSISEEASLDLQAAKSSQLYSAEPSFASDLPDSSSCSTASLPRDAADGQLSPLQEDIGKLPTRSDERRNYVEAVEVRGSKRRKRTTIDQRANVEDQKRVRRIIRNLEHFEIEQKTYGKQQLRAIQDGLG